MDELSAALDSYARDHQLKEANSFVFFFDCCVGILFLRTSHPIPILYNVCLLLSLSLSF